MYETMDAHALTVIAVIATIMVIPIYVLGTYVFSGAFRARGMQLSIAFLIFDSLMFWGCLSDLPARLGLPGYFFVPAAWILPSAVLFSRGEWFLNQSLSQK